MSIAAFSHYFIFDEFSSRTTELEKKQFIEGSSVEKIFDKFYDFSPRSAGF